MITPHRLLRRFALPAAVVMAAAAFSLIVPPRTVLAQDHGQPGPEEIQKKIREIEKLMKKAEESLARSTHTRESAKQAARRVEELLDEKARDQTGKSSDQLRKEAKDGSSESAEALRKLTEEARTEAAAASAEMARLLRQGEGSAREATEGVRKLIEKTKESGKEASAAMEWLLTNAVSRDGGRGGGSKPPLQQKPEGQGGDKPKDGENKPKQPKEVAKPPESDRDPKRRARDEQWLATLPPQVRRAYESRDWDAIPVKWRSLLREWTKKMNDELDAGRR